MKLWRCMGYYPDGSNAPIGFIYYSFAGSAPNEFSEDITSVENIDLNWQFTDKDYVIVRELLKTYKVADVWNALSDNEKKILITHSVYPDGTSTSALGFSQSDIDGFEIKMLKKYWDVRFERKELLRSLIFKYYKTSVATQFDIQSNIKQMAADYLESGYPEITYWFAGTVSVVTGVDYSSTGYPSKSYYDVNFKTSALNIFTNGNY